MSDTTPKVAALPVKTPAIHPSQFGEESFAIHRHHVFVPENTPIEALTEPGFWAHVAYKLQPFARITVDCVDMSWSATLKVTSASRLEARVVLENLHRLESLPVPAAVEEDKYGIKFAGAAKWRVFRKADGAVIKDGLSSKEDAMLELKGHIQAMAA